jgi:precorrin-6Y C5,15-methyltransferase (decarboxylating)
VTSSGRLTVVGVDGSALSEPARAALAGADLVVGSQRLLDAVEVPAGRERLVLGPLGPALERIQAGTGAGAGTRAGTGTPSGSRVVVLVGGDPGLFGIVRRLRDEGLAPDVLPAVSSVATLFARLGRSWESAAVVSAHGRGVAHALNTCRALPVVAVLTGPGAGPAELGAGLVGWPRQVAVGERLGSSQERVVTGLAPQQAAAGHWAEPNTVVTLPAPLLTPPLGDDDRTQQPATVPGERPLTWHNQPAATPEAGWALPEDAYLHRNAMITKREVRALAVARLRPRLGTLVWDVGAGSGSVGIECAALGAAVIAVEADPDACDLIRANATRHAAWVRVVPGRAPQALASLPAPDAVFVGGGGPEVLEAVARRGPRLVVATLASLDRLVTGVQVLRGRGYHVDAVQLSASRLATLGHDSLRLAGTNPIVVLTGERA